MRVLELFSGTGSVAKVCAELGYECISVDINSKFHTPTHLVDIMNWNYKMYPPGHFDIVWASPPCAKFSSMRYSMIGRQPKGRTTPYTREDIDKDMEENGVPLLRKTEEIITYFNPTHYFMKNYGLGG